jgi:hypothetical protein
MLLLALPPAAGGEELPPKTAPAYSGVYRLSQRSRVKPLDEWQFHAEDTVTIAVLGSQSRWDHRSDGRSDIHDAASNSTVSFGGKIPAKTAHRIRTPFKPIGWEFGYETVDTATPAKPEILGTATIAGHQCTRIQFISTQYGKPEFCVDKRGIVLRFANASSTAEATFEATSIDEKAPDKERFTVPAGYAIEDRTVERRRDIGL